jgi:hypothetical protein
MTFLRKRGPRFCLLVEINGVGGKRGTIVLQSQALRPDMDANSIATLVIDSAVEIHRKIGPGLRDHVYATSLAEALARKALESGAPSATSRGRNGPCGVEIPQCPQSGSQETDVDLLETLPPQTRTADKFWMQASQTQHRTAPQRI